MPYMRAEVRQSATYELLVPASVCPQFAFLAIPAHVEQLNETGLTMREDMN